MNNQDQAAADEYAFHANQSWSLREAFLAGIAHERARSMKLYDALESIAATHLTEDQIKACGGDTLLTDAQIARHALAEYRANEAAE